VQEKREKRTRTQLDGGTATATVAAACEFATAAAPPLLRLLLRLRCCGRCCCCCCCCCVGSECVRRWREADERDAGEAAAEVQAEQSGHMIKKLTGSVAGPLRRAHAAEGESGSESFQRGRELSPAVLARM